MKRRFFLNSGVVAGLAISPLAFPQTVIKMIVGFGPGSATDILARLIAPELSRELGVGIIVENRPGADGYVSALTYKTSNEKDSFLFAPAGVFLSVLLKKEPAYTLGDFNLVTYLGDYDSPVLYLANRQGGDDDMSNVDSLQKLLRFADRYRQSLFYGTGNLTGFLSSEQFASLLGLNVTRVPYKSEAEALFALAKKELHFMFGFPTAAEKFVQSGDILPVADSAPSNTSGLLKLKEVIPEWTDIGSFVALLSRADQTGSLAEEIRLACTNVLADKDFRQKMRSIRFRPSTLSARESVSALSARMAQWRKVIAMTRVPLS